MAPRKRAAIDPGLFAKTEPASQQDALPLSQQAGIASSEPAGKTVKATFYLDPATLGALDMARAKLRGMAAPEERSSITLSALVDAAIRTALQDLEAEGTVSPLASKMLKR